MVLDCPTASRGVANTAAMVKEKLRIVVILVRIFLINCN
jgi:hypothetical protein